MRQVRDARTLLNWTNWPVINGSTASEPARRATAAEVSATATGDTARGSGIAAGRRCTGRSVQQPVCGYAGRRLCDGDCQILGDAQCGFALHNAQKHGVEEQLEQRNDQPAEDPGNAQIAKGIRPTPGRHVQEMLVNRAPDIQVDDAEDGKPAAQIQQP